ncbi:SDR family oxidoreductase [Paenibacillus amylolyticus]|uniref:Short chain dehydrogenase n=1 Tax=Paenibacillus amylolyticus TaxID=1451 RepID=A0A100VNW7_PAEAM|nr:SDR family oxidoreductase [Paenibacillus amylolyticus]GAS83159.1 short chain dehydrogenase [Paenibacillus amylolyticus]
MTQNNVWFVTGASKGLGLALVQKLLSQGFSVAATSRNKDDLIAAVTVDTENFLPLQMDLVDELSIQKAISEVKERFRTIDVVVNNAGYGQLGAIEEISDMEVRNCFDVNVFGTINVIRAVLPIMRQQQSGHILNVASIAGFRAGNRNGIYAATKFAVDGLTESLAADGAPFGIKATCVLPGYFRTKFLSEGSLRLAENPLDAYKDDEFTKFLNGRDGAQMGDPNKAADVFIELSRAENPPVHLFLGNDAQVEFHKKMEDLNSQATAWKELSTSTDFEE